MAETTSNGASPNILEVRNLKTYFFTEDGVVKSVDGVDFTVRRGEVLGLVGESGCGKSVTSLSIMRLIGQPGKTIDGEIFFDGRDLLKLPETEMVKVRGNKIAMIFQQPQTALNPVFRVGDQIAEVLDIHRSLGKEAGWKRAIELLKMVGIPDAERRAKSFPHELSGGMAQRVMIAMGLACVPELLIADEPTTALDVTIQAQILDLIRDLRSKFEASIILITHDLGVVAQMATRVGVMYAGEIVEEAPRAAFFASPRHPYTQKLFAALPNLARRGGRLETIPGQVPPLSAMPGGCRFAARCAHAWDLCRQEAPQWREVGPDHRVRCHLDDEQGRVHSTGSKKVIASTTGTLATPALLAVADLCVHFPIRRGLLQRPVGYVRAVDGVSLELARGRTLALVGESGCGKSTTGRSILRLVEPNSGSVVVDGEDVLKMDGRSLRDMRKRMQIIFQDPFASLNPRMSVGSAIAEPLYAHGLATTAQARDKVSELLDRVGLKPDMASRFPHEFSGGQRQRICIARALALEPEFLILDEAVSALDVSVQAQVLNVLNAVQRELGTAYLFITHDLAVVRQIADDVVVLRHGRVAEAGGVDQVLTRPRADYTRLLLDSTPRPGWHPTGSTAASVSGA